MTAKALVLIAILVTLAVNLHAVPTTKWRNLIVFGDSISDSGNAKVLGWPQMPYYNGRYTNGKAWNEFIPAATGLRLINYAFAAATSDTDMAQGYTHGEALLSRIPAPGVKQLVDRFLGESWMSEQDYGQSCAVLWLNGVNYLANITNDPADVIASIFSSAEKLYNAGVRCFLFGDMIDPTKFPRLKDLPLIQKLYWYKWVDHTKALEQTLTDWPKTHQGAVVLRYNVNTDLNMVMTPGNPHSLPNVVDGCTFEALEKDQAIAVCDKPGDYAWWDPLHPTTQVHQFFSQSITDILNKA